MQLRTSLKRLLLIVGITGISFLLIIFFLLTFFLPGHVYTYYTKPDPYYTKSVAVGLPVHLEIPKINVNAPVIPVGVAKDGSMEAPSGPKDVGWFKSGSRPGDVGSAVIDGHYGYWKSGVGSVFDDLDKLRKGDEIYVEDDNGVTVTFVVRKILTYDPSDDASSLFNSSDGKSHLNLITCEGIWDSTQETYSNRLVIFTDKE
jgi:LPXTG-site transpeptidase (sortase) family protein